MTATALEPPPTRAPVRLSAVALFKQSLRVVFDHPREAMLPLAVVQVPVSALTSIVSTVWFLTAFKDQDVDSTTGGPLLLFLLLTTAEALFAQVARAGTIVSIAGVVTGQRKTLTQSLDPAFTRMGHLILLVLILAAGFFGLVFTIVGLVVLPYLALRVAISFETFILEDLSPGAAIRRAWTLTRGNTLRLLGLVLLTFVAVIGPIALLQVLALVHADGRTLDVVLAGAVTFIQGVLLIPFVAFLTASTTLFYLNLVGQNNG